MAALIGLLAVVLQRFRPAVLALALVACCAVAFFGVQWSYACSVLRYGEWERHRMAMAELLQVAPRVRPGTIIVLTNVPKKDPPCNHNMWFDMAIRLAYPGRAVAGVFYFEDGAIAPGAELLVKDGKWQTAPNSLVTGVDLTNLIIVRYDPNGHPELLKQMPAMITSNSEARQSYRPAERIFGHKPDKLARRRYIR